jgi:hypothetical protein
MFETMNFAVMMMTYLLYGFCPRVGMGKVKLPCFRKITSVLRSLKMKVLIYVFKFGGVV